MTKYNLKDVKFWYPPFNMGIPFNCIDLGAGKLFGYDYVFKIVADEAELLLPDGKHMPVIGTVLFDAKENKQLPYKMFSFHGNDVFVQVNLPYVTGFQSVTVDIHNIYILGDPYDIDD